MSVTTLVAFCKKEWAVVSANLWHFIVAALVCLGIGYGWAGHEDKGHDEALQDQLALEKQGRGNDKTSYEQRISGKDDLLTEYRTQLQLAQMKAQVSPPSSGNALTVKETQRQLNVAATRYSNASNKQLSDWAEDLAGKIRKLSEGYETNLLKSTQERDAAMGAFPGKSKEEQNRVWESFNARDMQYSSTMLQEYNAKYKADAIVISDEMLSRLPPGTRNDFAHYDNAAAGIERISTDLERLARLLPLH
jgi:hypothetical protein